MPLSKVIGLTHKIGSDRENKLKMEHCRLQSLVLERSWIRSFLTLHVLSHFIMKAKNSQIRRNPYRTRDRKRSSTDVNSELIEQLPWLVKEAIPGAFLACHSLLSHSTFPSFPRLLPLLSSLAASYTRVILSASCVPCVDILSVVVVANHLDEAFLAQEANRLTS